MKQDEERWKTNFKSTRLQQLDTCNSIAIEIYTVAKLCGLRSFQPTIIQPNEKKKTSRHPAQICLCQHESNIMGESANTSQKTKHRPTEIKQYYSNYSIRNAHRRHGIIELNLDFLENLTIIVLYILADQKPSQKNVAVLTSPPNNDCSQHSTTSKTCFMHV